MGINIEDVFKVLDLLKPYLIAIAVFLVAAIVITFAVGKLNKPLKKLVRKGSWLTALTLVGVVVNMIISGPMSSLINQVFSEQKGDISEESIQESKDLAQKIAEEGIVLAKNTDGALPLESGKKVNIFGWSSTNPLYGGTGSGSLSTAYPTVTLLDGIKQAGIEYNQELVDFYTGWRDARPVVGMVGQDWTIPEPTIEEYKGLFESAKEYSDTAVLVIARSGGEGADLPTSYAGEDTFSTEGSFGATGVRYSDQADDIDADKHYLELSNREQALLDKVNEDYENIILIINSANAMELGFTKEYEHIKSVLLCPGTGQTGFNGLGNILAGKVNPSAKTVDTFVTDLLNTPSSNNFGHFAYENMSEFSVDSMFAPGGKATPTFVNYNEGIYVGYRFYETAAAEGLIDYDKEVVYPFGYGLSYTTFEQEMGEITEADGMISFEVKVTNTGDVAGKDVVQVYYNPPYTNGGIEKATANLITFEKTGDIQPGASETVKVSFKAEEMASYDSVNTKGYILEKGDYEISINKNAHEKIASKTYTVASDVTGKTSDKVAATNQFDFAVGNVTYLSRKDHFANYAEAVAAPASYVLPEDLKATYFNTVNWNYTDYNKDSDPIPTTGANNNMKVADLRGVDYDDPRWEQLLDQLTIEDMNALISKGGYQTAEAKSVGKVQTIDCDGPASINNNFTKKGSIGFPAGVMIAQTWNKALAYDFGDKIGKMADEMEVSGWYAPALNVHRSAFAGRNFEYYSEDAVISGYMTAKATLGAAQHGVYAYLKHFATNDQETNRTNLLCTWSNEQALREVYFKGFEIGVKEGQAHAVMTAFNNIGTVPAEACPELLNTVLRDEWGFQGFALTDFFGGYGYQDADRMIRNGNDCMLAPYDSPFNVVEDTTSGTSLQAMRTASKNILFTTVNSRAYAQETNLGLKQWQKVQIGVDVVLAALVALLGFAAFKKYKKETSANA